ncbi:unnamed protein product [Cyclocybe aegerita]|uniref:Uncharacterized protein n=1 Tax=Cyclocybe aegerita TaxID=1973307 RepID=A0A8S0W3F7_CYCAE|nr:unnamed protein product [Cyclocybe aegerita]CAA7260925.1 unnamed protein product [Cyclocybe aegerita]CAA7263458.1 unnamed protein product [Cyclocybe aegerita]CAA7264350.1 unnamed protein product [Cyclocybe aegerita]
MGVSTATGAYALVLVVAFLCGYALGARHGPAFRQGAAKKVGPAPAPAPPVRAACTPPPLPTHAPGSQEDHEAVLRWASNIICMYSYKTKEERIAISKARRTAARAAAEGA